MPSDNIKSDGIDIKKFKITVKIGVISKDKYILLETLFFTSHQILSTYLALACRRR